MHKNWRHNAAVLEDEKQREAHTISELVSTFFTNRTKKIAKQTQLFDLLRQINNGTDTAFWSRKRLMINTLSTHLSLKGIFNVKKSALLLALLAVIASPVTFATQVQYDVNSIYQNGGSFNGHITYDTVANSIISASGTINDTFGTSSVGWVWNTQNGYSGNTQAANQGLPSTDFLDFLMAGTAPNFSDFVAITISGLGSNAPSFENNAGQWNSVGEYSQLFVSGTITPSNAVPEPTSIAVFGIALAGLAAARRKIKHV